MAGSRAGFTATLAWEPTRFPKLTGALSFSTSGGVREENDLEADKDLKRDPCAMCCVGPRCPCRMLPTPQAQLRGAGSLSSPVCCIGLPWKRNADFPQLLFYLLDIVIHLMLGLGGGEEEGLPGACLHRNHSGNLGRCGREWRSRAGAEVARGWARSLPPTRRRLVCMQGRAGPSGREAPTAAPSH